eukprot:CAMPEP_0170480988 /NCGR_PEP_ID=MMETSP0208-20121228/1607_1 /TAXON_ID=197538 /ORGANISM="Strombidium inclinatum, Strain S3" /LENGTH=105 /DNA_ID=CAMNT_0010753613 /DNA_START=208 /DNA_END=525 /DNA_ORIENTATION=-
MDKDCRGSMRYLDGTEEELAKYDDNDKFRGILVDLRSKEGLGQLAEVTVTPGYFCKIRLLYDTELYPDDSPSFLRKRQLSIKLESVGNSMIVLKSLKIGIRGEQT